MRAHGPATDSRTASCPQCPGRMTESAIEVVHTHDGLRLKVREVPAWVCASCGKRVVTSEIAERINHLLDEVAGPGLGKRIH